MTVCVHAPAAPLFEPSAVNFTIELVAERGRGARIAPQGQRTTAATESVYLMMRHAFDADYRRVEWKCDSLHVVSRKAAQRLGFRYEGTFANATHYKGRSRDTAWFAVTSEQWPGRRRRLEAWLDPANFDEGGNQLRSLSSFDQPNS